MGDAEREELLRRIERLEDANERLNKLLSQTAVTAYAAGLSVARLGEMIATLNENLAPPSVNTSLLKSAEKAAERLSEVLDEVSGHE